jgi:hypothetical protein
MNLDMDDGAFDAVDYMLFLLWTCLSLTASSSKNPILAMILAIQQAVEKLLAGSLLSFATNLFDALQAPTPPTLAFFKSLPTNAKRRWAVYVLVLEKSGEQPGIYIGLGTDSTSDVIVCLWCYDNNHPANSTVRRRVNSQFTFRRRLISPPFLANANLPRTKTK